MPIVIDDPDNGYGTKVSVEILHIPADFLRTIVSRILCHADRFSHVALGNSGASAAFVAIVAVISIYDDSVHHILTRVSCYMYVIRGIMSEAAFP
jgi:hypothetical protein